MFSIDQVSGGETINWAAFGRIGKNKKFSEGTLAQISEPPLFVLKGIGIGENILSFIWLLYYKSSWLGWNITLFKD